MSNEIIITAYPKSGITWFIHMLGDLLDSPQIDLDEPDYPAYYWGEGRSGAFILRKRHDAYSPAYDGKTVIRLQRDPRDVLISAMYYRNNAKAGLMSNLTGAGPHNYCMAGDYLPWQESWDGHTFFETRYEWLHLWPQTELLRLLHTLELPENPGKVAQVISRHRFEAMQRYMSDDHFMRRGLPGDWANHFTRQFGKVFDEVLGAYMLKTGYIENRDWYKELS